MPHDFMPGLDGVPAATSSISDVDGQRGVLEYRGIRVETLCAQSSFLETSYLLLFGRLPTRPELDRWTGDVTHHRRIKFRINDLLKCLPETGHPMDALGSHAETSTEKMMPFSGYQYEAMMIGIYRRCGATGLFP